MPEMIDFLVTQTRTVKVTPRYSPGESPEAKALEEAEAFFDSPTSTKVKIVNTTIERTS